ncbi:hypothetical protein TGARI_255990 [Toxoplasma gondii ARI]|uniref:Uncharacterized protein n=1 Tax=Toxoplasma gondii ARI TaxID=1074872 RepID=A0A139Y426_TOXGO|nr:hypothetical protein TGARI_255990 [Toxoplasma gondii ARI]
MRRIQNWKGPPQFRSAVLQVESLVVKPRLRKQDIAALQQLRKKVQKLLKDLDQAINTKHEFHFCPVRLTVEACCFRRTETRQSGKARTVVPLIQHIPRPAPATSNIGLGLKEHLRNDSKNSRVRESQKVTSTLRTSAGVARKSHLSILKPVRM